MFRFLFEVRYFVYKFLKMAIQGKVGPCTLEKAYIFSDVLLSSLKIQPKLIYLIGIASLILACKVINREINLCIDR